MAIDSRLLDCASIPQLEENFDRVLAIIDVLKVCRVTFNSDGGSAVSEQLLINGAKVTAPSDPTKDGYLFDGWFVGEDEWNFDTVVSGDLTLTAHWTEEPTEP